MDRSLLGSAIKVYPSKNNRTSRSYRPSSFAPQHTNVFLDDDGELDVFDKLVIEEKVKVQNYSSLAKSFADFTAPVQISKRSTLLRDVANTENVVFSADQSNIRKKTRTKKRDKENIKHNSRLFLDDDDDDIYAFNLNPDGSTCTKTKRRASSKPCKTSKSELLREQRLRNEKFKKAQELRERLQLQRVKSRFSKICSTPNRDASVCDIIPDVSFINKVDCSPTSTLTSVVSTTEKSSDIFMRDSFKRITSRKKLSFVDSFREERKPLSPASPDLEFSCCDNDSHKNSGSSAVRSVGSEDSEYVTCLRVENSDGKNVPEKKSNSADASSSPEKSKTSEASQPGRNHCHTNEFMQSKNCVSHSPTREPWVKALHSVKNVSSDCCTSGKVSASDLLVDKMSSMNISENSQRDDLDCEERNPSKFHVSVEDSNEAIFTQEDLKVLDSEKESEDSDTDKEVQHLTNGVERIHLANTSCSEVNTSGNSSLANGSNSEPDDSRCSLHSDDYLSSEYAEVDQTVLHVNQLRNITNRRTSRFSWRSSLTSELDFTKVSSDVGSESLISRQCENDEEVDVDSENRVSGEQCGLVPLSDAVHKGRETTFSSRRSSRYSDLFDLSVNTVVLDAKHEDSNTDSSAFNLTSKLSCLPPIERTRKSTYPQVSVFEPVLEESEELSDSSFENSAITNITANPNFTMRRKRTSIFSTNNDEYKEECSTVCREDIANELNVYKPVKSVDISVTVNSRRGTRFFSPILERSDDNETVSSNDTVVSKNDTVVEDEAKSARELRVEIEMLNSTPDVTLKISELSPIKKVLSQSLISSNAKDKHRMTAIKQMSIIADEEESRFESTRTADTNATKIFQRTIVQNDSGNSSSEFSFNGSKRQSSQVQLNCTTSQPIYLEKGKKWRRSFITFKNIMNHRLTMVEKEDCGRFCNQGVQNLISLQNDATIIMRELQECSTLKTGFDETVVAGFEEGDTISATKCERSEKARFSLSVNVVHLSRDVLIDERNVDQIDYARESLIDHHHRDGGGGGYSRRHHRSSKVQAGDFDNILRSSLPLLERSCTPDVAREIVLKYCNQTEPLPFEVCFPDSELKSCLKIGEGVYGEVFMLKRGSRKSVIKIIPIEGDQLVNGEKQKTFEEIFSELVITVHLSDLKKRGGSFYTECFAELKNRHCVYGRYPRRLITLWKEYDLTKGSENDSPTIFKDDQLYIILELDHGGGDIESFAFNNAQQTLSVFNQVTNALAVAEQAFEFEHRDLHWGNVLVTRSAQKKTNFVIRDRRNSVKLNGVKVTIIDYTLSRITIRNHTLFNDLGKDPDLFVAEGDFQFEVYRMMRNVVGNVWNRYVPETNVYWLRYLLDKMLKEIKYVRDGTMLHQKYFEELEKLYNEVLIENYSSAYQLVENEYRRR